MFYLWRSIWTVVLLAYSWIAGRASAMLIDLEVKLFAATKKFRIQFLSFPCLLVCIAIPSAHAVLLNDWIFNIDGTISDNFLGDPIPTIGTLDDGLGTLSLEMTGAGAHNVIGFFDFEIDQTANSFYNEFAEVNGTPGIGQSWEVDEPGRVFGDIADNVYYGSLDNTNAVPHGQEEDVSYALGWSFSLLPDEVAVISYVITDELPNADFFITQADPDDPNRDFAFYFYSDLTIQTTGGPPGPTPSPVPEPGTATLLLVGLPLLWSQRRRLACFNKGVFKGENPWLDQP